MFVPWLFVLFAVARGDQASGNVDDVHRALITEAAVLPTGLFKRDIATCAFVSGDSGRYAHALEATFSPLLNMVSDFLLL
jgi:hypothetical protein